jgi:hypothetical protein
MHNFKGCIAGRDCIICLSAFETFLSFYLFIYFMKSLF